MIPNTLLIATTSYAGMGPYVASIVNCFDPEDTVRFFLVESEDRYYTKNLKSSILPNCKIVRVKEVTIFSKLSDLLFNGKASFHEDLRHYCQGNNIRVIHALTPLTNIKLSRFLGEYGYLLNTIHDLKQHESKKAIHKMWRENVLHRRIMQIVDESNFFLTNSKIQYDELNALYPHKATFYTPFPSLITDVVKDGGKDTPEIRGLKDYVLFFGRIEEYKGLDILIKAFQSANLPKGVKLVIAGKGEINNSQINNENVVLINRYIDDQEIKSLYLNAECVVYPYISATQSGVLSVASYFGTPIIASDVDFFKETLGEDYEYLFKTGDVHDLKNKLESLYSSPLEALRDFNTKLYKEKYDSNSLRSKLMSIYDDIANKSCQ